MRVWELQEDPLGVQRPLLVVSYNQQFGGTILLMVFDLQGIVFTLLHQTILVCFFFLPDVPVALCVFCSR